MPDDSRDERLEPREAPSEKELFAYIAETCLELGSLGIGERFRVLNYLLEEARKEAESARLQEWLDRA